MPASHFQQQTPAVIILCSLPPFILTPPFRPQFYCIPFTRSDFAFPQKAACVYLAFECKCSFYRFVSIAAACLSRSGDVIFWTLGEFDAICIHTFCPILSEFAFQTSPVSPSFRAFPFPFPFHYRPCLRAGQSVEEVRSEQPIDLSIAPCATWFFATTTFCTNSLSLPSLLPLFRFWTFTCSPYLGLLCPASLLRQLVIWIFPLLSFGHSSSFFLSKFPSRPSFFLQICVNIPVFID